MGILKIRKRHLRYAMSKAHEDPALKTPWQERGDAARLQEHYRKIWKKMGIRVKYRRATRGKFANLTTTYYSRILLSKAYVKSDSTWQAATDAHETIHARQWRTLGRVKFAARYAFSSRWRWAIEMQAYCESIRALYAQGASEATLKAYIDRRAMVFKRFYAMRAIKFSSLEKWTRQILEDALSRVKKEHAKLR